jgi:hypothetical protein
MKTYATHSLAVVSVATLLLTMASTALAQTNFELPRECLERQVVNPERCIIQDGPPRLPLVPQSKRPTFGADSTPQTTPQPIAAPPAPRTQPSSSAPFSARR